jgi:hypothetical protein
MRNRILYLDIDGVLNCEEFFTKNKEQSKNTQLEIILKSILDVDNKEIDSYKKVKKQLRKDVKKGSISRMEFYSNQICRNRVQLLNKLCKDNDLKVVVSSTWRLNKTIEELQEILDYCGATFEIIGKTPDLRPDLSRGVEIKADACHIECDDYVIIDDDNDMLDTQQHCFFQTSYKTGLTQEICDKITEYFNER